MKPILLSLLFFIALCNLRFKDQEQLEQHHKHISTNQQPLIVHIIPHSHDDVGWLKTVEQYFYGLRNDIQWANVEYIIDSYVEQLQKDPKRKFIQVEIKFFKMWWDKQTIETQNIVKQLVNSRQLQFISGGWCMNDEATTYYEDIIDQMTIGHKFLLETFNVIPSIGWQIDPFGHQNSQASLSYQMGFNAWFFARIDYEDKEQRLENQNMETIMIPPTVGVEYPIFTHVQYYHYEAPSGFNFDANRDTDTIVDDINSKSFNLIDKANKLVQYFRAQSSHYKGNHLIHTFGSDFQWSNAKIFYQNLDKLINYINNQQYNMTLIYSTPEEYIQEINKQNISYSTKQDDFFPYSDRKNAFWTGYFTSRIAIKGYVKRLGRQAQTYRKFIALIYQQKLVQMSFYNITNAIYKLDDALAICQHHDAVTGTEQQHVNDDYIDLLSFGEYQIKQETQKILSDLIYGNYFQFEQCEYNQTADSCKNTYQAFKQNKTVTVTLIDGKVKQYNQTEVIRIKVPNLKYLIKDSQNRTIYGDVDCTSGFQDCDLFFTYQIPQNNVVQYFTIQPVLQNESASEIKMNVNPFPYTEETLIQLNSTKQFKLKYAYYKAYQGRDQPEGAYLFRIENKTAKNIYGNVVYISIGYGRIMSVFRIVRTFTKTVIKNFYHDIDTFDIQTFVDSISVDDDIGKDIIMLVEIPNFNNNNTFYTDSNGLQFQERILNYRPQYNWSLHEPITGNYYPINGAIYIKDGNESVALLNDRSQGGSSLQNGQIEIMIHRRLLLDDYRGVGEALDETDDNGNGLTQYIQHKLTFFNNQNNPNKIRKLQYFQDQYPLVFLDSYGVKPNIPNNLDWFLPFKGLKIEPLLQYGDNLLKFNYLIWNEDELLLRIQNLQESYSMKIDKLEYDGQMIRKTLTGNQNWSDWKQNSLKWNYVKSINNVDEDYDDILYPLQIQTYLIRQNDQLIK